MQPHLNFLPTSNNLIKQPKMSRVAILGLLLVVGSAGILAAKVNPSFKPIGCFKDAQRNPRPLPKMLKNLRPLIDWNNVGVTIDICAKLAQSKGYKYFGIQFYGECWSGADSFLSFAKDGRSTKCTHGVGESRANFVYEIVRQDSMRQCGAKPQSRIIGGQTAIAHEWPWQAEILMFDNTKNAWLHRCGGTLINAEWIVTAAHCLFLNIDPKNYRIRLGEHDRSNANEGEMELPVSVIHIHTRFLADADYGYDIALMKLAAPAIINSKISPVCLPELYHQIQPGKTCFMTGWGMMTTYPGPRAQVLQQAQIPVVSYKECAATNNRLHKVNKLTMICAGYGGNSSISGCHGDSGGPFVCQEDGGRWVLRGAVSWGDNECKGRSYSVFTRISSFVDWIDYKMTAEPLKKPSSCIDAHFYCEEWKAKGWCKYGYFAHMLKGYYCKKTCGAC